MQSIPKLFHIHFLFNYAKTLIRSCSCGVNFQTTEVKPLTRVSGAGSFFSNDFSSEAFTVIKVYKIVFLCQFAEPLVFSNYQKRLVLTFRMRHVAHECVQVKLNAK